MLEQIKRRFMIHLGGLVMPVLLILIIVGCVGIVSYTEAESNKEEADRLSAVVAENDGEFNVLHVVPVYDSKGHFRDLVSIVGGVKNGKRIEVESKPSLPVPGEVWEVSVLCKGCCGEPRYRFVRKIR